MANATSFELHTLIAIILIGSEVEYEKHQSFNGKIQRI